MQERVTYWNRAAEYLYGWSAEELEGRSIGKVLVTEAQHELAAGDYGSTRNRQEVVRSISG